MTVRQHSEPIEALFVREGGVQPSTADREARTIDIVLSDERAAPVRVFNRKLREVVNQRLSLDPAHVRLDRLNNSAPFLIMHGPNMPGSFNLSPLDAARTQIGKIVEGSARIIGKIGSRQLVAKVVFSRNLADAEERIVQDMFDGIRRNISAGFEEHAIEIVQERDGAPLETLAVDWEPFEGSSVTMGADDSAMTRALSPPPQSEANAMTIRDKGEAADVAADDKTEPKTTLQIREVEVIVEREVVREPTDAEIDARADAKILARETRVLNLRKLGKVLSTKVGDVDAWIAGKDSFEDIRALAFEAAAAAADKPDDKPLVNGVRVGAGEYDEAQIRGLGMLSYLLCDRDGRDPEQVRSSILKNQDNRQGFTTRGIAKSVIEGFDFRGAGRKYQLRGSLLQMAAECLRSDGYTDVDDMGFGEIIEHALGIRGLQGRGLNTTSSFPLLLAEVLNVSLRIGYDEYPLTFLPWTQKSTASDFRRKYNVTMGEADDLVEIVEGEEIPTSTIGEARESYRVLEHARIFGMTYKLLVNDRLNGLTGMGRKFGKAGNRRMRQIIWDLVTTGLPVLNDALNVYTDGSAATRSRNDDATPSVFSIGSVDDMRVRFTQRQGLRASVNVPHELRHILCAEGNRTFTNQVLGRVTTETRARNTAEQVTESFTGLGVHADPIMDAFDFTSVGGGLGTGWIGTDGEAVEWAFLQGSEGVQTAVKEEFETRGMKIRATLDFGGGVKDWRGLDRNAGA